MKPARPVTDPDALRRARIAWGIAMICGVFLLETWNAHQVMPNPASPVVWTLLGSIAAGAAVAGLWFGHRARRGEAPAPGGPDPGANGGS